MRGQEKSSLIGKGVNRRAHRFSAADEGRPNPVPVQSANDRVSFGRYQFFHEMPLVEKPRIIFWFGARKLSERGTTGGWMGLTDPSRDRESGSPSAAPGPQLQVCGIFRALSFPPWGIIGEERKRATAQLFCVRQRSGIGWKREHGKRSPDRPVALLDAAARWSARDVVSPCCKPQSAQGGTSQQVRLGLGPASQTAIVILAVVVPWSGLNFWRLSPFRLSSR